MSTPKYIYRRRAAPKSTASINSSFISPSEIQRKCDDCKKEDKDKRVQRKAANSQSVSLTAASFIPAAIGNSLPKPTQQFFAARMGHDFSEVNIHTGAEAEGKADAINAKAYTLGNHIVFNKGQYDPESSEGKKLLAHELTHVIQQRKGDLQIQRAACCGEAYQLPQTDYEFNINEEILFQHTFCVNTKGFKLKIKANWTKAHSAEHYYVQVYEENNNEDFTRRYDIGREETQSFRFKKADSEGCNFFRVIIKVGNPVKGINLKGSASLLK